MSLAFLFIYLFNAQHVSVLYVLPRLTFKYATFCPQNTLCFLYGFQYKQLLFPHTTSRDSFLVAFEKIKKKKRPLASCLSVRPHRTRLPLDGFS